MREFVNGSAVELVPASKPSLKGLYLDLREVQDPGKRPHDGMLIHESRLRLLVTPKKKTVRASDPSPEFPWCFVALL